MQSPFLHNILKLYRIIRNAVVAFRKDNVIKLCASLSYYTVFSLPPLLLIIIATSGYIFGEEAVQGQLFFEIQTLVGKNAAIQIQEIIKNLKLSNNNGIAAIIGMVILLFGATGVFSEIQSSINQIWKTDTDKTNGILFFLKNKLMSLSMIASVSFLLIVCLIINTVLSLINNRLEYFLKDSTVFAIQFINWIVVFMVINVLFTLIFSTLPYRKLKWKYIIVAAFTTSSLFMIGKYFIGIYIGNSQLISIYGAAGTLIVLLTWVYYSAIILYFGAEIARAYAESNNEFNQLMENVK